MKDKSENIFTFKKQYFILTVSILLVEIYIALYVHDQIIRPHIGDLLVVILIYCFLKSFFELPVFKTAISVLIFAYMVEVLQFFNIADRLGLEHIKIARIIIGGLFDWLDIASYSVGIAVVLITEKISTR